MGDADSSVTLSALNREKQIPAKEFALKLWPHIEAATKSHPAASQAEIARLLSEQGLKTRNGAGITQSLISRYIRQASKVEEWYKLRSD